MLLRVKLGFSAELNCYVSAGKDICIFFSSFLCLLDRSSFCFLCSIFVKTKFMSLMFMMPYSVAAFFRGVSTHSHSR